MMQQASDPQTAKRPSDQQAPKEPRTCRTCKAEINEAQARLTFEEYDTQMCKTCALIWQAKIDRGDIHDPPPELQDPESYEVYSRDDERGLIYKAIEGAKLPAGAVPVGFCRPFQNGPSFELFFLAIKTPKPKPKASPKIAGKATRPAKGYPRPADDHPPAGSGPASLNPASEAVLRAHGFYTEPEHLKSIRRRQGQI